VSNRQDLLKSVPLFADLPPDTLDRIERLAVERKYPTGADVVTQGERGVGFFVVVDGSVEVVREPGATQIATLKAGDFFGEMALLEEHRRTATVTASSDVRIVVMHERDFRAMEDEMPEVARRIRATMDERRGRDRQRASDS